MKHACSRALALVLALALLSVSALAADFTGRADDLNALGLFQGSGTDENGSPVYGLDRAPTRAEAVTMLVRLLGKESEALAGDWDVPFTDLSGASAWALPYVGYAYANGLTLGETDTLFGTGNLCSAQMYCTFVLRSLGYSDTAADAGDADFTYAEAVDAACALGLLDPVTAQGEFLRDEVVAVSYAALATPIKGSETLLIEKLAEEGAVDADAAQALADKADTYREYSELLAAQGESVDLSYTLEGSLTSAGVVVPVTAEGRDQVRVTAEGFEMASVMTSTVMEQSITVVSYVRDGILYINDGVSKTKSAVDDAGLSSPAALWDATGVDMPLYFIDTISRVEDEDGVAYTLTIPGSLLSSLTSALMGEDVLGELDAALGGVTLTVRFADGAAQSISAQLTASASIAGLPSEMLVSMEADVNALGDDVAVSFPSDLDGYTDAQ